MQALSQKNSDNLPQHEELLVDYAERLEKHLQGRRAVHVHLSQLRPHNRREHHLRIAAGNFDALVAKHEGQCFQMRNGDIVVVAKDCSIAQIDDVILKLRYLFSEDPLAQEDETGEKNGQFGFCSWYELEQDYPRFLALARRIRDLMHSASASANMTDGGEAPAPVAVEPREPLDPARLGKLESALRSSDMTTLMRRQAVCLITPQQAPRPVFNEIYVSIEELRRKVLPDVNLMSRRWLFMHLTESLDLRLLKHLPELEADIQLSTSLNLNISTLLSEQFLSFDRLLRHYTKKSMIVELQVSDIYADMGSYQFAREFVRSRGYKICIDGLTHLTFPMVRRDELDADLMKVVWSPELLDGTDRKRRAAFREAVNRAGPSRVVLCRCDNRYAIEFGESLGITMYQGRHVDRLVKANALV
tara:strand:+ start:216 stop:1466 length:1251 start_codon:yes stop_codon:yes gene_type:complete